MAKPGLTRRSIGDSTYTKPAEIEWQPTQFGEVSIRILCGGSQTPRDDLSLKAQTRRPHSVPQAPSLVLEESVEDHDGSRTAGDYTWRIPDSLHENFSLNRAAPFAVYRKPKHLLPRRYHAACETKGF
jgi:hypothetical protein